jgi:hypothetical protein
MEVVMSVINAAEFEYKYGFIADCEKGASIQDLYHNVEARMAIASGQQFGKCLGFDAKNVPYVTTYKQLVSAQPSWSSKIRLMYQIYNGTYHHHCIEKVRDIFAHQVQVATECMTISEKSEKSLQDVRDRTRRLHVMEIERKGLIDALRNDLIVRCRYINQLSYFQRVAFKTCWTAFSVLGVRTNDDEIQSPLPITSVEFARQNPVLLSTCSIASLPDSIISVSASVLPILKTCPTRTGIQFSISAQSQNEHNEIGALCVSRHKNHLTATVSFGSENIELIEKIAMELFVRESVRSMNLRINTWSDPSNVYKCPIQDNDQAYELAYVGERDGSIGLVPTGQMLPVITSTKQFSSECLLGNKQIAVLPIGSTYLPTSNNLSENEPDEDALSKLAELKKLGEAILGNRT